jgi:hypothetical protein
MERPQAAGLSNTMYKRRLAADVVNKQSQMFDKGLLPTWVVGRGVNSYSLFIIISMLHRASDFGGFFSGFFVRICRTCRISKYDMYLL